jgi:pimeloyl-ACP methyl ester carboxylesterase
MGSKKMEVSNYQRHLANTWEKKVYNMKSLIVLPGWGGNKKTWSKFTQIANATFDDVLCYELPCFGDEPCPPTPWGVEGYASFVSEKISKYKSKNPEADITLLGHSFGGQVAVQLLSDNPTMVDSLVLSGAAVLRPKKYIKRGIFFIVAKIGRLITTIPVISLLASPAEKFLYKVAGSPDYSKTSGVKKEIFKIVTHQDLTHLLCKVKIPTLVLWGKKDTYTKLAYGKIIAKLIPNADLHVFEDGKHGLHLQKPDNMIKRINAFLEK